MLRKLIVITLLTFSACYTNYQKIWYVGKMEEADCSPVAGYQCHHIKTSLSLSEDTQMPDDAMYFQLRIFSDDDDLIVPAYFQSDSVGINVFEDITNLRYKYFFHEFESGIHSKHFLAYNFETTCADSILELSYNLVILPCIDELTTLIASLTSENYIKHIPESGYTANLGTPSDFPLDQDSNLIAAFRGSVTDLATSCPASIPKYSEGDTL